ncbi:serine hydrolase domain-containing protein [Tomitella biformata]|uniref:serine hydrolase domain-containing protein n=1 Tax=Tomitella biformata TaxID=630403 RepID=UPI000466F22B|nr:serine hydrolase domain-containing protein [Tomitella biformata]
MNPLNAIASWPVDNAAAAVITRDGQTTMGDLDKVFELASVTKLLVAYGALLAVEEGVIELDQPAGPEGSTVRHLLAHASGLGFADRTVEALPGERRIYSSAGFEVLAELISAESGIVFADYLAEAVFEPLGMASTTLWGVAGHEARSSVADLSRFALELLNPVLAHPLTVADATTVQFPGLDGILPGYGRQRPNDWGLGFEIRGEKSPHWTSAENSPRTFGHFGQAGTFLWVDPDLGIGTVVLTDRPFGAWAKPLWASLSDDVVGQSR